MSNKLLYFSEPMSVLDASFDGNLPLLKSLKENGEELNIQDEDGDNALLKACRGTGNIETIKWLIDQGFSQDYRNKKGYNAFLVAAFNGHLSVLKFFKEINIDIKATGPDGQNALHRACVGKGDIDTIKWLLNQGFPLETPDSDGKIAFYFAVMRGHTQLIRLFLHLKSSILNMKTVNGLIFFVCAC